MEQVIVIGGGVAGLTCAVHLAERGLRPLLIEADPVWLGGGYVMSRKWCWNTAAAPGFSRVNMASTVSGPPMSI
ncbi:MAG: FAD-dependent oxidoreductase [Chloroflexi bacterium]|nr:FAD-dependent oxidoreductase [Chloroflexota bacterium]